MFDVFLSRSPDASNLCIVSLALAAALIVTPANAGSCLKDSREFSVAEGDILKLRDYLCQVQNGSVRVQFHRVNDLTFGAVINDVVPDALKPILGNSNVVKNEVYREWNNLLQQFGEDESVTGKLAVFPAGDRDSNTHLSPQEPPKVKVLVPSQGEEPAPDFPLEVSVISEFKNSSRFSHREIEKRTEYILEISDL